jgi:CheY-like chemotaxis protein
MQRFRPLLALIEDNPADVELIRLALEPCDAYEMEVMTDGERAIEFVTHAEHRRPTLFVIDLNLPKRNGFEVLEAIRAAPTLASAAKALVLSSSVRPSDRERALSLGADWFQNKPSGIDEMEALGDRLCTIMRGLE